MKLQTGSKIMGGVEEKEGSCSKVHSSRQGCDTYSLIPNDGHFIYFEVCCLQNN